jgi:InsA N-terminal domain
MTFISVRCPHCRSEQIVKRGKTHRGTQRYLCLNTVCTKGSSLNLSLRHEVARLIVWHVVTRPVVPSAVSYTYCISRRNLRGGRHLRVR